MTTRDLSRAYRFEPAPSDLQLFTKKPRGAQRPTLHTWDEYIAIKTAMFERFELADYDGCLMGEARKRQIPNVMEVSKTAPALALFQKRAPALYELLIPQIKPPIQPLDKRSSLGFPWFKQYDNKRSVLLPEILSLIKTGPLEHLGNAWIQQGLRLQPEPLSKERTAIFLSKDGEPYQATIDKDARYLPATDERPEGYSARYRGVFNLPSAANLCTQIYDTAVHSVQLRYKYHNGKPGVRGGYRMPFGKVVGMDVKNFDFFMGPIWRARAAIIGGLYQEIVDYEASLPVLVTADDRRSLFFMWVNDGEYSMQFPSGASAVAPQQKDLFVVLTQDFGVTQLRMTDDAALQWALNGGDGRLGFMNYGDDNLVWGDPALVDDYLAFIGTFLTIEIEDPTKFLGFRWTGTDFRLMRDSYILKTWLNERAPFPPFRLYPHHGWTEKRRTYGSLGDESMREVFAYEDELMRNTSLSWPDIEARAEVERRAMSDFFKAAGVADIVAMEKEYLLEPHEKMALPGYQGIYPSETAPILTALLSPTWRSKLR